MNIRCIKVEVDNDPKVVFIEDSLVSLQREVEGLISTFYPFKDPVLIICNDEGKINGKCWPNRKIYDENGRLLDTIWGNFLVIQYLGDIFVNMEDIYINKYLEYFSNIRTYAYDVTDKYTKGRRASSPPTADIRTDCYTGLSVNVNKGEQFGPFEGTLFVCGYRNLNLDESKNQLSLDVGFSEYLNEAMPFDLKDEDEKNVFDNIRIMLVEKFGEDRVTDVPIISVHET